MEDVYIYDAIRSPRARAKETGGLHALTPLDLLQKMYAAIESRNKLDLDVLGEVVLGCVTQHGDQAGNIAKTSTLYAGWPSHLSGITVNRFCSSGLDAVNFAALKVAAGGGASWPTPPRCPSHRRARGPQRPARQSAPLAC